MRRFAPTRQWRPLGSLPESFVSRLVSCLSLSRVVNAHLARNGLVRPSSARQASTSAGRIAGRRGSLGGVAVSSCRFLLSVCPRPTLSLVLRPVPQRTRFVAVIVAPERLVAFAVAVAWRCVVLVVEAGAQIAGQRISVH